MLTPPVTIAKRKGIPTKEKQTNRQKNSSFFSGVVAGWRPSKCKTCVKTKRARLPFGKRALLLDLAMFPLPFSKII